MTNPVRKHPGDTMPSETLGRVLVADDDPMVRGLLSEALATGGFLVTLCEDGKTALSCYQDEWREIDLVVMDVRMPALRGPDALAEMRRINPDVRAILCSAHPLDPGDWARVGGPGVAFLQKPFPVAELIRCATSVLAD